MIAKSKWQVVAASVQGTSHQKRDIPCQDAHAYRLLPDGILLIAVADGAGAAEQAAAGAALAIAEAMRSLEAALQKRIPNSKATWRSLLVRAFTQAHQAIIRLAASEDGSPQTFATTLTCVIASAQWLAVGQIGDGLAVAQAHNGRLFTTLRPQRGEYANETCFLTMDNALEYLEIKIYRQSVRALAVITDGLARLAINMVESSPHEPFFQPLFSFAAQMTDETEAKHQLAAFLSSERVCRRTDDDKTLVLAVRNES
jgi:hypothetical protein